MKKFYMTLMAVACIGMTAEAGIYLRGGMNGWNADSAWEFELQDSKYVLTDVNIVGGVEFKVADENWGAVNCGSVKNMEFNTDYVLENSGSSSNCSLAADFKGNVIFDLETTTIRFEGGSGSGVDYSTIDVYLRGGMNDWGVSEDWKFVTDEDFTLYYLHATIDAGVQFKIADSDWGIVNIGGQSDMAINEIYAVVSGGNNMSLATNFKGIVEFNREEMTVTFQEPNSVKSVDQLLDCEYFNLNGQRVMNPENGIYIMKSGDKVQKIAIR